MKLEKVQIMEQISLWSPIVITGCSGLLLGGLSFRFFWNRKEFFTFRYKLVLIVPRTNPVARNVVDKSKLIQQCSTISINAFELSKKQTPLSNFIWNLFGQPKIILQSKDSKDFASLSKKASSLKICSLFLNDFKNDDLDALMLSIGPGPSSLIDIITGNYKLLNH
ncbi:integral membrane protein [Sarcoptes scabiei]|nr:integral membrane protein [Sarcoptes scabiei]